MSAKLVSGEDGGGVFVVGGDVGGITIEPGDEGLDPAECFTLVVVEDLVFVLSRTSCFGKELVAREEPAPGEAVAHAHGDEEHGFGDREGNKARRAAAGDVDHDGEAREDPEVKEGGFGK